MIMATELWKRVALYLRIGWNMIISMHNNANITFIHLPATFQTASYDRIFVCVTYIPCKLLFTFALHIHRSDAVCLQGLFAKS